MNISCIEILCPLEDTQTQEYLERHLGVYGTSRRYTRIVREIIESPKMVRYSLEYRSLTRGIQACIGHIRRQANTKITTHEEPLHEVLIFEGKENSPHYGGDSMGTLHPNAGYSIVYGPTMVAWHKKHSSGWQRRYIKKSELEKVKTEENMRDLMEYIRSLNLTGYDETIIDNNYI